MVVYSVGEAGIDHGSTQWDQENDPSRRREDLVYRVPCQPRRVLPLPDSQPVE